MGFEKKGEINPVEYGVLWERVKQMDQKITKMEAQLDELIALANKGKGGLWLGMLIISSISVLIGYVINVARH